MPLVTFNPKKRSFGSFSPFTRMSMLQNMRHISEAEARYALDEDPVSEPIYCVLWYIKEHVLYKCEATDDIVRICGPWSTIYKNPLFFAGTLNRSWAEVLNLPTPHIQEVPDVTFDALSKSDQGDLMKVLDEISLEGAHDLLTHIEHDPAPPCRVLCLTRDIHRGRRLWLCRNMDGMTVLLRDPIRPGFRWFHTLSAELASIQSCFAH